MHYVCSQLDTMLCETYKFCVTQRVLHGPWAGDLHYMPLTPRGHG